MNPAMAFQLLALVVIGAPLSMLFVLGGATVIGRPVAERATGRILQVGTVLGLLCAVIILGLMLLLSMRHIPIEAGTWVNLPDYHFSIKFVFDRLSVPFVILTFVLCGTIGTFAVKYMHQELGFNRFFVLYALFMAGMVITSLAGTIETLFAGWEMVGLSSALLVAFFQERAAPVRNGLRVWIVYRVSDAALLIGAVAMHQLTGAGDFAKLLGAGPWPEGVSTLTPHQALVVGLLLLVAAAGKSAMIPFSGWLPRAMEGPTPSSAVFYGSLSVHLGAFLLLRVSPLLDLSTGLSVAVISLGLITALFASLAGRVQTDIKSALAFASLTQVGIIFVEIGCGLRYIALLHILGHACLRTLQFLRAPSLLYDYRRMENAIGSGLPHVSGPWERLIPHKLRGHVYRLAIERGYLDAGLTDYIAYPFLQLLRTCDGLERRWSRFLDGTAPPAEPMASTHGSVEELL